MMLRGIGQPLNEYLPTGAPWTLGAHSSVLAWRIRGMGKPGGLPSLGSHRVGHDWSDFIAAADTGWSGQPATKSSPLGTHATIYSMKCVCVCVPVLGYVWLSATLWTEARQTLLSMGFSPARNTGVDCQCSSRGSSWPGIELTSPAFQADSLLLSHQGSPV